MPQDVAAVMEKPISQELLGSGIPARFSYVGLDGDPRVIPIGFLWSGRRVLARITIEPDWAKLLDFETTIPKAVEDLVRAHHERTQPTAAHCSEQL
jgi:hypothetical protein